MAYVLALLRQIDADCDYGLYLTDLTLHFPCTSLSTLVPIVSGEDFTTVFATIGEPRDTAVMPTTTDTMMQPPRNHSAYAAAFSLKSSHWSAAPNLCPRWDPPKFLLLVQSSPSVDYLHSPNFAGPRFASTCTHRRYRATTLSSSPLFHLIFSKPNPRFMFTITFDDPRPMLLRRARCGAVLCSFPLFSLYSLFASILLVLP